MSKNDIPLYDALDIHLREAPSILGQQAENTPVVETPEPCLIASGSGDSQAAALTLAASMTKKIALALDPADGLATPWLEQRAIECALVALSVGGRTRSLIELARLHKNRGGRVIAVTADPESPLARLSHTMITLVTGEPSGGVGGVRHLAMLVALARAFKDEDPVEKALSAPEPGECPGFSEPWTYVGVGDSRGTAYYASLKANEAMGVPNPSTSIEEILHAQAFALPTSYIILHPAHRTPTLDKRIKTAASTLASMGRLIEWPSQGSVFVNALAHSFNILRCLAKESRAKRIDTVAYKKHPLLPQLTQAIYGERL